jgi:hypothetical protein
MQKVRADWGNLGIIFSMLHNKFGHSKEFLRNVYQDA